MKLIHLGDLHLGKNVNDFSMIEDQRYILNEIKEIIKDRNIDGVIMAGDIYDRSVPSEEAVKLLDSFITDLAAMEVKVFAVSGNHDSDERLNYGSSLFENSGVYIAGRYDGTIKSIEDEDEYGKLKVWLMPYVKASRVAHYFPDEDTSTYDAAFRTAIKGCNIDKNQRNVIVVHQFVTAPASGKEPELAGSETVMLNVGTVDRIGSDCFDDFDYVAMGHIHTPQAVGRETCRYSGSPLKYSLNVREITGEKSVPVITLEEKGSVQVDLLPLKPRREVRHIKGQLHDLLENAIDTDDYIYATLTDEVTQFDAMARLQEVYPNVMKLDYDNAATRAMAENSDGVETEGKSFDELMNDFFSLYHGRNPEEKEWQLIMQVAEEAGVIV